MARPSSTSRCGRRTRSTRTPATSTATTSSSSATRTGAPTTKSSSLLPGNGIEARIETARGKIARIQRELVSEYKGSNNSLYAQDTFTSGPPDAHGRPALGPPAAENAASTAKATRSSPRSCPTSVYDGSGTKISWSDVSPRVGFTYALDDARKTSCAATSRSSPSSSPNRDVTSRSTRLAASPASTTAGTTVNNDDLINDRSEVDIAGGPLGVPVNAVLSHRQPDRPRLPARPSTSSCSAASTTSWRPTSRWARPTPTAAPPHVPYASYIGVNGSDWVPCDSVSSNGYTVACMDLGPTNAAALGGGGFRPAADATARTTTAPTAGSSSRR